MAEKIKLDDLWIFNPPHPHLCSPRVIFYVYIYQVEFLFESQSGLKIVIYCVFSFALMLRGPEAEILCKRIWSRGPTEAEAEVGVVESLQYCSSDVSLLVSCLSIGSHAQTETEITQC